MAFLVTRSQSISLGYGLAKKFHPPPSYAVEVNEAFSGASVAINRELGLDTDIVNVNGGSVALGHPIGASGARLLVTLLHNMQRRNANRGLVSLCLGGGEAIAMVVRRES